MVRQLFVKTFPVLLLGVAVPPAYPVAKEIVQIQRDVAILQIELRQIKSQTGERMAVLEELIKQNLEMTGKLNQAIAVIERSVAKQSEDVVKPVTSINTRVDSLAGQFGALRDAVEALNTRMSKLQQSVEDIQNHLTTMPPPSFEGEGASPATSNASAAETLYNSALSDFYRGNFDISKQQFDQYLKLYGQTLRAPEAQYYLGDIAYQQQDYAAAIKSYDSVLERYPEGTKSPDALYKKGLALMMLNKLPEAAAEFKNVVGRYPTSTVAANAQAQIEELENGSRKPSPTRGSFR